MALRFVWLFLIPLLAAAADDRTVILMVGSPGAGKTTQARKLSRTYGIPSITLADLLKQSSGWGKAGSRKQLQAQIESGELVNDEIADQVVRDRLLQRDTQRGFVLDGYPANARQAENLEALLKERGLPSPVVILIDVPDPIATQRMKGRGRADDQPAFIERRLANYHKEEAAILEHYRGVVRVDGTRPENEVWKQIEAAIAQRSDHRRF